MVRNKQIAGELSISESTINFHIKNIVDKLWASGRTHALTIALRRGLLDAPHRAVIRFAPAFAAPVDLPYWRPPTPRSVSSLNRRLTVLNPVHGSFPNERQSTQKLIFRFLELRLRRYRRSSRAPVGRRMGGALKHAHSFCHLRSGRA